MNDSFIVRICYRIKNQVHTYRNNSNACNSKMAATEALEHLFSLLNADEAELLSLLVHKASDFKTQEAA